MDLKLWVDVPIHQVQLIKHPPDWAVCSLVYVQKYKMLDVFTEARVFVPPLSQGNQALSNLVKERVCNPFMQEVEH